MVWQDFTIKFIVDPKNVRGVVVISLQKYQEFLGKPMKLSRSIHLRLSQAIFLLSSIWKIALILFSREAKNVSGKLDKTFFLPNNNK